MWSRRHDYGWVLDTLVLGLGTWVLTSWGAFEGGVTTLLVFLADCYFSFYFFDPFLQGLICMDSLHGGFIRVIHPSCIGFFSQQGVGGHGSLAVDLFIFVYFICFLGGC